MINPQSINKLKKYYADPSNLWLPPQPQFAQFKANIKNAQGMTLFRTCRRKIKTTQDLSKWLLTLFRNNAWPHKVYVTAGRFLSPELLRGKNPSNPGWKYLRNIFLHSGFLLDFDKDEDYEQVRQDYLTFLQFLKESPKNSEAKNFKILYTQFSGSSGLHVYAQDPYMTTKQDPFKRMEQWKQRREKLRHELKTWLTKKYLTMPTLDPVTIADPYRVYKLANTFDMSTGIKISIINQEDLKEKTFQQILSSIPRIHSPAKPEKVNDKQPQPIVVQNALPKMGLLENPGDATRSGQRVLPPLPYNFIKVSNNIFGTKDLNTPLFYYYKKFYKQRLLKAQRKYNLGPLYKFEHYDHIIIYGLAAIPKKQMLKIMKKAGSLYVRTFQKYKHQNFQVTPFQDLNGNYIKDTEPKLVDHYPALYSKTVSAPHLILLSQILEKQNKKGLIPLCESTLCGKKDYKFIEFQTRKDAL